MKKRNRPFPSSTITIAPSILSADFSCLLKNIKVLEKAGVSMLHLDVMDGHFVPNISFGPCVVHSLRPYTKLLFDVHLMIYNPLKYLDTFASSGADILTVHLEVINSEKILPENIFRRIRRLNKKVGLSISPNTPVANVYPYLNEVDLVLIMTVEPGFGSQKMILSSLKKIYALRRHIDVNGYKCAIEADGGINENTISSVVEAGADILVCGSVIFGKSNIKRAYTNLLNTFMPALH
jgi:ribulose-phosphate 3-epimerase